jgi:putative component of toxin-antitoxin plasmid stabilization module
LVPESPNFVSTSAPAIAFTFGKDGERLVILLGGGSKKRQQSDIAVAHALWVEYKKRKREE